MKEKFLETAEVLITAEIKSNRGRKFKAVVLTMHGLLMKTDFPLIDLRRTIENAFSTKTISSKAPMDARDARRILRSEKSKKPPSP